MEIMHVRIFFLFSRTHGTTMVWISKSMNYVISFSIHGTRCGENGGRFGITSMMDCKPRLHHMQQKTNINKHVNRRMEKYHKHMNIVY